MSDLERAFTAGFCIAIGIGMALCHAMSDQGASNKALVVTGSVISGFGILVLVLLGPLR